VGPEVYAIFGALFREKNTKLPKTKPYAEDNIYLGERAKSQQITNVETLTKITNMTRNIKKINV